MMTLAEITAQIRTYALQQAAFGSKIKLTTDQGCIFIDGTQSPPSVSNNDAPADHAVHIRYGDLAMMSELSPGALAELTSGILSGVNAFAGSEPDIDATIWHSADALKPINQIEGGPAKKKRARKPTSPRKAIAKRTSRRSTSTLTCTYCNSPNVKAASLVKAEGTFSGSNTVTGLGVTTQGQLAVGIGRSKARYESSLSKSIKTPNEKNCVEELGGTIGVFVGIALGFLIGGASQSFLLGFLVLFGCTAIGMAIGKGSGMGQAEEQRISNDKTSFSSTYVCLTCGSEFIRN